MSRCRSVVVFRVSMVHLLVICLLLIACEPAPEVVRPQHPDRMDPAVVALVAQKVAVVEADPDDAFPHGDLGLVYEANLLWAEAQQSFENAVELAPESLGWRLHLALALRQNGDFAAAHELLETLAKDRPRSAPVHQRLGEARLELGNLDGAAASFRQVTQLEPTRPEGFVGLGDALLQQGQPAAAAEALERARAMASSFSMTHYLLGRAYQQLGRDDDARRALALGHNAAPSHLPDEHTERVRRYAVNLTARIDQAQQLLAQNQAQQAEALLSDALRVHPENIDALNSLAIAYLRQNKLGLARRVLDRAEQLDPDKFHTYLNLSSWAIRSNLLEEALRYTSQAVELAPTLSEPNMAHGQTLMRLDRYPDAEPYLAAAVRYGPMKPETHALYGDLLAYLGRPDEALDHYAQALALNPNMLPAEVGSARVMWERGNRRDATAALERAQQIAPQHPMVISLARQFQRQR